MKVAVSIRASRALLPFAIALAVFAAYLVPRALAKSPPGHFTANGEIVTDAQTGRTWQVVPLQITLTYAAAETACANLSLGGFDDWRLPTLLELHSIIDGESLGPVLLDPLFEESSVFTYWSMTRDPALPGHYAVDVRFDQVTLETDAGGSMATARCVR